MRNRPFKVMVYLNKTEYETLNGICKKTNLGKSNLFRYLLQGYEPLEAPPVEFANLVRQMRHIGNNLKQIAYNTNNKGFLNPNDLQYHLNELMEIEELMRKDFDFHNRRKTSQQLITEVIMKKYGS